MKYIFVTQIFNLEIPTSLNRGKEIRPGARITNNKEKILEIIDYPIFKKNMGPFSYDEFTTTPGVHYIAAGEINAKGEVRDKVGNSLKFFFLREIQNFIYELWIVRDNNVYIRDGFLLLYDKNIEDGYLYKASVSAIISKSDLSEGTTKFTPSELDLVIQGWSPYEIDEDEYNIDKWKNPNDIVFRKRDDVTPKIRGFYNVVAANSSSLLPMKILFYCAALEALFSYEKTDEISHKIAERVALFIGKNTEDKISIFSQVKKAYSIRSRVIHGSYFKDNELNGLGEVSKNLDNILRTVYTSPKLDELDLSDAVAFQQYFLLNIMS